MLLIVIAAAAFSSTLAGGLLALGLRDKLHLILGFSAGAVIGVAFFDLLPESISMGSASYGAGTLMTVAACGFLAYLVLDRMLLFHGDSLPRAAVGAGVLCVHSLLDGFAIGLAFQASRKRRNHRGDRRAHPRFLRRHQHHECRAQESGRPRARDDDGCCSTRRRRRSALPRRRYGVCRRPASEWILALFAGFFLYIGASDLIPESYHAHPKLLTTVMTLAGAAVLYLAVNFIG